MTALAMLTLAVVGLIGAGIGVANWVIIFALLAKEAAAVAAEGGHA